MIRHGLAHLLPLGVVVGMHDVVVHLGKQHRRLDGHGQRGSCTGRADGAQLTVELRPVVAPVLRVDPVKLIEENPDGLRAQLPQFLDVRLDHHVALQAALPECERGHVPNAVRRREIDAQLDRFGCEPAGEGEEGEERCHEAVSWKRRMRGE